MATTATFDALAKLFEKYDTSVAPRADYRDEAFEARRDMFRALEAMAEVLDAAETLGARLDNITSEEFAAGGERTEREALRTALAKMWDEVEV